MLGAVLFLLAAAGPGDPDPRVHHGREGQHAVRIPKLEGAVALDGALDEPQWRQAAILTGFSQFFPVDGVPAADSTEVFVWYSASALHVGIRAHDASGTVRATLAERDRIGNDDQVQLYLSTFNDGRQATYLAVNPLGVQADGALNESGGGGGCNGFNCATSVREFPDLSQDFVWESKGRLVEGGYEVELRIPFKSIRFQSSDVQTWGIHVMRIVQRTGQEQSWMPVRRGAASFLAQAGKLEGLEGLRAGRALDIVPTLTSRVDGSAVGSARRWDYGGGQPEIGGNIRWGVTPNLTLNATANPDFSQVESDVGQFAFDPRQALFFPERRPFFLDGVEQFTAPEGLVYTRRIVQPVIASKVTGKVSGTQVGVLAAVDDAAGSRHGENPFYGIVRLTRDLGPGSRLGFLWTEQHDGPDQNRVLNMDGRIVVGGIHSFTFQGALARDEVNGTSSTKPLFSVGYRRNGRAFRARYSVGGIDPDFVTRSGFISRPGIARVNAAHSYTWLRENRTLESLTGEVVLDGTWRYDDFVGGDEVQDKKLHFNVNARFRGGWTAGVSLLDENFGYDPSIYTNYGLQSPTGEVLPFTGVPRIPNRDYVVTLGSPAFDAIQFNAFVLWGKDENFFEWASGDIIFANGGVTLRPTEQLRLNLTQNLQQVKRPTDGSLVSRQSVTRARVEYQLSRAFQVRVISQYAYESRDALRDNTRTELPIVIRNPATGAWQPTTARRTGAVRTDFLFSYFPNPGTVLYLGYGASHLDEDPTGRRTLFRTDDGFFLKLSYLFRLQG